MNIWINSNKIQPNDAQVAIGELTGVDVSQNENKQVEFSYSAGIAGMEKGKEVNNHLLQAVGKFSEAVLIQAINFLKLLPLCLKSVIEQAQRWESNHDRGC